MQLSTYIHGCFLQIDLQLLQVSSTATDSESSVANRVALFCGDNTETCLGHANCQF